MPIINNIPIYNFIVIAFAVLMLFFVFASVLTIYSLMHFGKSKMVAASCSLIFAAASLIIFIHTLANLI